MDAVRYYVDGLLVQTDLVAIGATMRPVVSDYDIGTPLIVDWLRMTPYAASGTFTSRVFDGGEQVSWIGLSWTADLPAGTAMTMWARTGDTLTPDTSWSAFHPVSSSGDPVGAASRYVQYEAHLSTSDPAQTPVLRDVTLTYVAPVLDHLVLSPATATIAAGASQAYSATGFDVHGNSLGDVTAGTTFSTDLPATCTGASCGATTAGTYTVTGSDGTAGGTTNLVVSPATLVSLAISPAGPTIAAGTTEQFSALGTYSDATTLDLTSSVSWTSGTSASATIGATSGLAQGLAAGTSLIGASLGPVSDSTTLTVSLAPTSSRAA